MKKNKTATLKDVTDKLDEFLKVLKDYKEEGHQNKEQYYQTRWRITAGKQLKVYRKIWPDLEYIATSGMSTKQKRSLNLDEALNRLTNSEIQKLVNVAAVLTSHARRIHGACNSKDSEDEATIHEVNEAIFKALRNRS